MGGFDWKANWKWVALGVGIFVAVIVIVVVAVVLTSDKAGAAKGGAKDAAARTSVPPDYRQVFLECNNERRKEIGGLPPLVYDDKLNEIAEKCAKMYADRDDDPSRVSSCPSYGFTQLRCYYPKEWELDYVALAKRSCEKWYFTPGHMLSSSCRRLGFAIVKSEKGTDHVVAKYSWN